MKKDYQYYVFDLYGTLVDIRTDEENPRLWAGFARYLNLLGLRVEESALRDRYIRLCLDEQERTDREGAGKGLEGPFEIDILRVWRALGKESGRTLTRRQAEGVSLVFRALSLQKLRVFPGAKELLQALRARGKKTYLLSNAQASFTRPELRQLGLDAAFDALFISSDAGVKKPSPDFFRLLRQAGCVPEETVMVGNDVRCDCQGAADAGMDSFYIHTEQSPNRGLALPRGCREIAALSDLLPPGVSR